MFWDYEGAIMIEYTPPCRTVTADIYFNTLMHLQQAIKEKRSGLLSEGVVLMHDNARPHTVTLAISLLAVFKRDVFPYPHIPSILHSHTTICSRESNASLGSLIHNRCGLHAVITEITAYLEERWYTAGIEKLVYGYKNNY